MNVPLHAYKRTYIQLPTASQKPGVVLFHWEENDVAQTVVRTLQSQTLFTSLKHNYI